MKHINNPKIEEPEKIIIPCIESIDYQVSQLTRMGDMGFKCVSRSPCFIGRLCSMREVKREKSPKLESSLLSSKNNKEF